MSFLTDNPKLNSPNHPAYRSSNFNNKIDATIRHDFNYFIVNDRIDAVYASETYSKQHNNTTEKYSFFWDGPQVIPQDMFVDYEA